MASLTALAFFCSERLPENWPFKRVFMLAALNDSDPSGPGDNSIVMGGIQSWGRLCALVAGELASLVLMKFAVRQESEKVQVANG